MCNPSVNKSLIYRVEPSFMLHYEGQLNFKTVFSLWYSLTLWDIYVRGQA